MTSAIVLVLLLATNERMIIFKQQRKNETQTLYEWKFYFFCDPVTIDIFSAPTPFCFRGNNFVRQTPQFPFVL